ncbi:hypothetical protein EMCRGX_G007388 [Ephydatia muelleri]
MEAAPPQSGIQSTPELQASTSVINRDPNVQQSVASQQPTQFQNIAGPVQPFYGNPAGQPLYYVPGYSYPHQENVQDPVRMAYANLPTQPHTTSFTPQLYGGNVLSTPQQPVILVQLTPVPINSPVRPTSGDNYLTLSVLMTFLVLLVGGWPSLSCTISALYISFDAKKEQKRGNIAAARAKANISLGLNITAVVFIVVVWSIVASQVAVNVRAQTSANSPYCYSDASSLYYCYQSSCNMYFHSLYYINCYYSSSYSYSAASNYYSNGYQSTYYQCGLSYQLTCVIA